MMHNDRRSRPRVKETMLALWGRWVRLSAARRIAATVVTAMLVGGVWFTACAGDGITSPNKRPQPGVPGRSVELNEQHVPVTRTVVDPCTQEDVVFSGYIHVRTATTIDESGGVHMDLSSDETSLSGVGTVTQNAYHASSERHLVQNTEGAAPLTMTVIDDFRILGPNPNDNYFMYMHSHVTVNANGTPTAQIDDARMECR